MTELSALAESEGYAACDDAAQRRSPSAARSRGIILSKKALEGLFDSLHPVHRHRVFYIYAFPVSSLFALRFRSARAVVSGRFSLLVSK